MEGRRSAAALALVAILLVALVLWWLGSGGGEHHFGRAEQDGPHANRRPSADVELAIDDLARDEPHATGSGEAAASNERVETVVIDELPVELVLRVDVPRSVRARFVDRTTEAPAWLEVASGVPLDPPLRVLGRRTGEGWQFRVRGAAAGPMPLAIELPGGVRVDEPIDLVPGTNRHVIDLGTRDGAAVHVALCLDEAILEFAEEQVDFAASASETLDASDPRGWIALVDATTGSIVARAPIGSTKRAHAPDDDLEFADAVFAFVPAGAYRAHIEGGAGRILVPRSPDASFVVPASTPERPNLDVVTHAIVLALAEDPERALAPVVFDVSAAGGAPEFVDLYAYGTWGAHGFGAEHLLEEVKLRVEDGRATLAMTALEGWTPLRFMLAADGTAPVFLDAMELLASAADGDPPVEVDLVPGSGGVLFAGGRWGSGARGPADGLVVEIDGLAQRVERGFLEVAFDHRFGFDAGGLRVPEVLGGEDGGAVPVGVEDSASFAFVEVDGR